MLYHSLSHSLSIFLPVTLCLIFFLFALFPSSAFPQSGMAESESEAELSSLSQPVFLEPLLSDACCCHAAATDRTTASLTSQPFRCAGMACCRFTKGINTMAIVLSVCSLSATHTRTHTDTHTHIRWFQFRSEYEKMGYLHDHPPH